jgi:hypothetical protein
MSQGGRPDSRQVLRLGDRQEREEDFVRAVIRGAAYHETQHTHCIGVSRMHAYTLFYNVQKW